MAIGSDHRHVEVDGRRMIVAVQGSRPRTVVLMPGLATPEPILGFAPLARRLAEQNAVVTVEPFGLGLSDGTDAPRTSEAIDKTLRERPVATLPGGFPSNTSTSTRPVALTSQNPPTATELKVGR